MMEAPVLSKSQMKRAIKKKKTKKSVRNVLSKPSNLLWPEISKIDTGKLVQKLTEFLQCEKPAKVSWKHIKSVPKHKRKETRKQFCTGSNKKSEYLKYVIFGINSTMKAIENGTALSVLISSDVSPQHMIKHIWFACNQANIPILVVPNLRPSVKVIVGFHATCLALKNTIPETDPFYTTHTAIKDLSQQFERVKHPDEAGDGIESEITDDKSEASEEPDRNITKTSNHDYLYRRNNERCFKPPMSDRTAPNSLKWSEGFVAFSDASDVSRRQPKNKFRSMKKNFLRAFLTNPNEISSYSKPNLESNVSIGNFPRKLLLTKPNVITKERNCFNKSYLPVKIKRLQSNSSRNLRK